MSNEKLIIEQYREDIDIISLIETYIPHGYYYVLWQGIYGNTIKYKTQFYELSGRKKYLNWMIFMKVDANQNIFNGSKF